LIDQPILNRINKNVKVIEDSVSNIAAKTLKNSDPEPLLP